MNVEVGVELEKTMEVELDVVVEAQMEMNWGNVDPVEWRKMAIILCK